MAPTRRSLLTSTAAVLSAGVLGSLSASASPLPEADNVDEAGDELPLLEEYQPAYDLSRTAKERMVGIYGWYADSDDHDVRAYYYWTRYSHQDSIFNRVFDGFGTSRVGADSHLYDHEPSITFVDQDSGEVLSTVFTGYHHFAAAADADSVAILEQRSDQPTHVGYRVIEPWHNYDLTGQQDEASLELVDNEVRIKSFLDARDEWVDAGIFDSTDLRAVDDPFLFEGDDPRASWWADDEFDAWVARNVWLRIGARGAPDDADLITEE